MSLRVTYVLLRVKHVTSPVPKFTKLPIFSEQPNVRVVRGEWPKCPRYPGNEKIFFYLNPVNLRNHQFFQNFRSLRNYQKSRNITKIAKLKKNSLS